MTVTTSSLVSGDSSFREMASSYPTLWGRELVSADRVETLRPFLGDTGWPREPRPWPCPRHSRPSPSPVEPCLRPATEYCLSIRLPCAWLFQLLCREYPSLYPCS